MNPLKKSFLIIDTDPGHDDALALLLLGASQQFEILLITTVAGNASIQHITNNARYVLKLMQADYRLHSGASGPLSRPLEVAVVHGEGGLAGAQIEIQEPLSGRAAEMIVQTVRQHPGQVSILTLGPLTNLATAFLQDEQLANLIQKIVIMGGAIEAAGNKNRTAEFNMYVDPEAASIVLNADVPKTLVPLDACDHVVLNLEEFEVLQQTFLYRELLALMTAFHSGISAHENLKGILVYDVLAAFALIYPERCPTVKMDVRVETNGELTRGMTVADRRVWSSKNYNCDVVSRIDATDFREVFFHSLKDRFSNIAKAV